MASAKHEFTLLTFDVFNGACEISIAQLMDFILFEEVDYLDKLVELSEFLEASNLELRPNIQTGEAEDIRVLVHTKRQKSFAEKLKNQLEIGETTDIEYKSTFFVALQMIRDGFPPDQCYRENVEFSAMKAIAGFLNKAGGELYIGVESNRNICGIELDFHFLSKDKRDFDGWVNRVLESITTKFFESSEVKNYIDIDMDIVDNFIVVRIVVKPRKKISFLKLDKNSYQCFVRDAARIREVPIQEIPDFLISKN